METGCWDVEENLDTVFQVVLTKHGPVGLSFSTELSVLSKVCLSIHYRKKKDHLHAQ